MSTTARMKTGEPPKDAGPEQIEKHIERTREDLGHTVEALSHKLDVKNRTRATMSTAQQKAGTMARRVKMLAMRPVTLLIAAGTKAAAVVGAVAWRRRH